MKDWILDDCQYYNRAAMWCGYCPLSCSVHCNVKCRVRRGKQSRKAAAAVSLSLLSRASLSVYTEQLSVCIFSQHSHSKMVKSHKDKVVHKAMKSIDKFYNEVPGNCSVET